MILLHIQYHFDDKNIHFIAKVFCLICHLKFQGLMLPLFPCSIILLTDKAEGEKEDIHYKKYDKDRRILIYRAHRPA